MKNPGNFSFFSLFFSESIFFSRIEYDAYRYDYERVLTRNPTGGVTLSNSEESIERQYHHFKERYEKLKADVTIKLRLLDDNRVRKFPLSH
jgi:hypothetical protein